MNACIIPAQRVARRFLSVRKMERRRERIRYYACLKHSGEVEAMVARRNVMDRTLIERGARARRRIKENPLGLGAAGKKMVVAGKARGALQELFIHLAHLGGKMSERVGTSNEDIRRGHSKRAFIIFSVTRTRLVVANYVH